MQAKHLTPYGARFEWEAVDQLSDAALQSALSRRTVGPDAPFTLHWVVNGRTPLRRLEFANGGEQARREAREQVGFIEETVTAKVTYELYLDASLRLASVEIQPLYTLHYMLADKVRTLQIEIPRLLALSGDYVVLAYRFGTAANYRTINAALRSIASEVLRLYPATEPVTAEMGRQRLNYIFERSAFLDMEIRSPELRRKLLTALFFDEPLLPAANQDEYYERFASYDFAHLLDTVENPIVPKAWLMQRLQDALVHVTQSLDAKLLLSYHLLIALNARFGVPGEREYEPIAQMVSEDAITGTVTVGLAVRPVATTYIIYQRGKLLRDAPEQQLQRYPVDDAISAADCLTLRAVVSVNPLQTPETLVLPFRLNELVRFPKRSPFGYDASPHPFLEPDLGDVVTPERVNRDYLDTVLPYDTRLFADNPPPQLLQHGSASGLYALNNKYRAKNSLAYADDLPPMPFRMAPVDVTYPAQQEPRMKAPWAQLAQYFWPVAVFFQLTVQTQLSPINQPLGSALQLDFRSFFPPTADLQPPLLRWRRQSINDGIKALPQYDDQPLLQRLQSQESDAGDYQVTLLQAPDQPVEVFGVHVELYAVCVRCDANFTASTNTHGACHFHTRHPAEIDSTQRSLGVDLETLARSEVEAVADVIASKVERFETAPHDDGSLDWQIYRHRMDIMEKDFVRTVIPVKWLLQALLEAQPQRYTNFVTQLHGRLQQLRTYLAAHNYTNWSSRLGLNLWTRSGGDRTPERQLIRATETFVAVPQLTASKPTFDLDLFMDYFALADVDSFPAPTNKDAEFIVTLFDSYRPSAENAVPLFNPKRPAETTPLLRGVRDPNPNLHWGFARTTTLDTPSIYREVVTPVVRAPSAWLCCLREEAYPGCWIGRHSAKTTLPDLSDLLHNDPMRGTQHINEPLTSDAQFERIRLAYAEGRLLEGLTLEAQFNAIHGGKLALGFAKSTRARALVEELLDSAASESFSRAKLFKLLARADLSQSFGVWERNRRLQIDYQPGLVPSLLKPVRLQKAARLIELFKVLYTIRDRDPREQTLARERALLRWLGGAPAAAVVPRPLPPPPPPAEQVDPFSNEVLQELEENYPELAAVFREVLLTARVKNNMLGRLAYASGSVLEQNQLNIEELESINEKAKFMNPVDVGLVKAALVLLSAEELTAATELQRSTERWRRNLRLHFQAVLAQFVGGQFTLEQATALATETRQQINSGKWLKPDAAEPKQYIISNQDFETVLKDADTQRRYLLETRIQAEVLLTRFYQVNTPEKVRERYNRTFTTGVLPDLQKLFAERIAPLTTEAYSIPALIERLHDVLPTLGNPSIDDILAKLNAGLSFQPNAQSAAYFETRILQNTLGSDNIEPFKRFMAGQLEVLPFPTATLDKLWNILKGTYVGESEETAQFQWNDRAVFMDSIVSEDLVQRLISAFTTVELSLEQRIALLRVQLEIAPNNDLFDQLSELWDQANATRPLYNLYEMQPLFTELHKRIGLTPWFTGAKETELLPDLPAAQLFYFYQLLLTTRPTPDDKRITANIALVRVAAFAGLQGKTLVELSAARNVERAAELKTALASMVANYRLYASEVFSQLTYTLYRELTALSPETLAQLLTPLVSRTGNPQGTADLKQILLQIEYLKSAAPPATEQLAELWAFFTAVLASAPVVNWDSDLAKRAVRFTVLLLGEQKDLRADLEAAITGLPAIPNPLAAKRETAELLALVQTQFSKVIESTAVKRSSISTGQWIIQHTRWLANGAPVPEALANTPLVTAFMRLRIELAQRLVKLIRTNPIEGRSYFEQWPSAAVAILRVYKETQLSAGLTAEKIAAFIQTLTEEGRRLAVELGDNSTAYDLLVAYRSFVFSQLDAGYAQIIDDSGLPRRAWQFVQWWDEKTVEQRTDWRRQAFSAAEFDDLYLNVRPNKGLLQIAPEKPPHKNEDIVPYSSVAELAETYAADAYARIFQLEKIDELELEQRVDRTFVGEDSPANFAYSEIMRAERDVGTLFDPLRWLIMPIVLQVVQGKSNDQLFNLAAWSNFPTREIFDSVQRLVGQLADTVRDLPPAEKPSRAAIDLLLQDLERYSEIRYANQPDETENVIALGGLRSNLRLAGDPLHLRIPILSNVDKSDRYTLNAWETVLSLPLQKAAYAFRDFNTENPDVQNLWRFLAHAIKATLPVNERFVNTDLGKYLLSAVLQQQSPASSDVLAHFVHAFSFSMEGEDDWEVCAPYRREHPFAQQLASSVDALTARGYARFLSRHPGVATPHVALPLATTDASLGLREAYRNLFDNRDATNLDEFWGMISGVGSIDGERTRIPLLIANEGSVAASVESCVVVRERPDAPSALDADNILLGKYTVLRTTGTESGITIEQLVTDVVKSNTYAVLERSPSVLYVEYEAKRMRDTLLAKLKTNHTRALQARAADFRVRAAQTKPRQQFAEDIRQAMALEDNEDERTEILDMIASPEVKARFPKAAAALEKQLDKEQLQRYLAALCLRQNPFRELLDRVYANELDPLLQEEIVEAGESEYVVPLDPVDIDYYQHLLSRVREIPIEEEANPSNLYDRLLNIYKRVAEDMEFVSRPPEQNPVSRDAFAQLVDTTFGQLRDPPVKNAAALSTTLTDAAFSQRPLDRALYEPYFSVDYINSLVESWSRVGQVSPEAKRQDKSLVDYLTNSLEEMEAPASYPKLPPIESVFEQAELDRNAKLLALAIYTAQVLRSVDALKRDPRATVRAMLTSDDLVENVEKFSLHWVEIIQNYATQTERWDSLDMLAYYAVFMREVSRRFEIGAVLKRWVAGALPGADLRELPSTFLRRIMVQGALEAQEDDSEERRELLTLLTDTRRALQYEDKTVFQSKTSPLYSKAMGDLLEHESYFAELIEEIRIQMQEPVPNSERTRLRQQSRPLVGWPEGGTASFAAAARANWQWRISANFPRYVPAARLAVKPFDDRVHNFLEGVRKELARLSIETPTSEQEPVEIDEDEELTTYFAFNQTLESNEFLLATDPAEQQRQIEEHDELLPEWLKSENPFVPLPPLITMDYYDAETGEPTPEWDTLERIAEWCAANQVEILSSRVPSDRFDQLRAETDYAALCRKEVNIGLDYADKALDYFSARFDELPDEKQTWLMFAAEDDTQRRFAAEMQYRFFAKKGGAKLQPKFNERQLDVLMDTVVLPRANKLDWLTWDTDANKRLPVSAMSGKQIDAAYDSFLLSYEATVKTIQQQNAYPLESFFFKRYPRDASLGQKRVWLAELLMRPLIGRFTSRAEARILMRDLLLLESTRIFLPSDLITSLHNTEEEPEFADTRGQSYADVRKNIGSALPTYLHRTLVDPAHLYLMVRNDVVVGWAVWDPSGNRASTHYGATLSKAGTAVDLVGSAELLYLCARGVRGAGTVLMYRGMVDSQVVEATQSIVLEPARSPSIAPIRPESEDPKAQPPGLIRVYAPVSGELVRFYGRRGFEAAFPYRNRLTSAMLLSDELIITDLKGVPAAVRQNFAVLSAIPATGTKTQPPEEAKRATLLTNALELYNDVLTTPFFIDSKTDEIALTNARGLAAKTPAQQKLASVANVSPFVDAATKSMREPAEWPEHWEFTRPESLHEPLMLLPSLMEFFSKSASRELVRIGAGAAAAMESLAQEEDADAQLKLLPVNVLALMSQMRYSASH